MAILPDFSSATFSEPSNVDNAYFPLPNGTINSDAVTFTDPETGEQESERSDHFASFETRTIEGVEVAVIRHTAYADDMLVEDTLDWYAQDDAGNVWYLGEISLNFNYDDDGNFTGTDFGGSWEAGVDGALPGYIMLADPNAALGVNYYEEFYAGVAEDEATVNAVGLDGVGIDFGSFDDVLKIRDGSALEPDAGAYKYYAPGVGLILEEEFVVEDGEDVVELTIGLDNVRTVENRATPVDPADLAFAGDGTEQTITFLTEDANVNGAVGAYLFDTATGAIGEGRILFVDTEDAAAGDSVTVTVPEGQSLGLFLVADVENLGLELEDYVDGGLWFRNFQAGDVAALYDGDPGTTYTPGVATIHDGLAPVVTDAEGNLLPIRAFHSVGNRDGVNFLNQVAGENAMARDGIDGIAVVRFEDGLASTEDYDADFNDAFIAVSDAPLSDADLAGLVDGTGISRVVGSDEGDRLAGTREDDQLIGLDGNDRLNGGKGDDSIEAGDGDDLALGGKGDDEISGEEGNDLLLGGKDDDEISGGEGDDLLLGGDGDDTLQGDEGDDRLVGGRGDDVLSGGEGNDLLVAGRGGARMAGGADDDILIGSRDADTFVFDLAAFGDDEILGFEAGTDLIEIATYTGVAEFADLDMSQEGKAVLLSFADGSVTLQGVDIASLGADDFDFV